MKRLTIRNSDGSVSQPTSTTIADVFEKLAAYEDTGLEPEEIRKAMLKFAVSPATDTDERINDIIKAEQEGRLVVLPCKVGDEMWFIACKDVMHGRCRNISIHSGGIQITFDDDAGEPWTVGIKRVFDSRAEAEKAMAEEALTATEPPKEDAE